MTTNLVNHRSESAIWVRGRTPSVPMVLTLGDGQSGVRPSVAPGGGRHPAARIWNSLHLDTAVALPVGVQVSAHAPRGGRRPAMQYLPVPADSPVGPGLEVGSSPCSWDLRSQPRGWVSERVRGRACGA